VATFLQNVKYVPILISLQFPTEIKTRGSKTASTFNPFHTKLNGQIMDKLRLIFMRLHSKYYIMTSKHLAHL